MDNSKNRDKNLLTTNLKNLLSEPEKLVYFRQNSVYFIKVTRFSELQK